MLNAFITFKFYFRRICYFLFYFHTISHKRIYFSFFYAHANTKEYAITWRIDSATSRERTFPT